MRATIPLRLLLLPLGAALGVGCGDNLDPSGGDDEGTAEVVVTDGGRFPVADCGRDIVTREGAEAPVVGGDTVGPDPTPFHVRLGVGGDPARGIAVVWRTDVRTTVTRIELESSEGLVRLAEGVTYRYRSGNELIRVHEVHLCGLTPDTEYTYRVGGGDADGEQGWSAPRTFRTGPDIAADPEASVLIAMAGDSRNGTAVWADVAADIATHAPDLLVFSGDAVATGSVQSQWDAFFDAAEELLATVPMVAAHGNHEANAINFYAQLAMPGDESSYSLDLGHAHLTVLNDTPPHAGDVAGAIRTFLDEDLGATEAPWTIITHHRPIWSSGSTHGPAADLQAQWGPVLDEHGADLVVAGHDHIYERTWPMRGRAVTSAGSGTVYLVNGGAGAPLYGVIPRFFSVYAAARHGWVLVDVRRDRMIVQAFEPGSAVPFDQLTLTR